MPNRLPGRCPVCNETMEVTSLHCPACDTTISGHFATCKFCQLSEEMQDFIEIFIRSRGNIKEVERALGISYPTVRGRLDAAINALGYAVDAEVIDDAGRDADFVEAPDTAGAGSGSPPGVPAAAVSAERRREILAALSKGEITAQEAAARLRQP